MMIRSSCLDAGFVPLAGTSVQLFRTIMWLFNARSNVVEPATPSALHVPMRNESGASLSAPEAGAALAATASVNRRERIFVVRGKEIRWVIRHLRANLTSQLEPYCRLALQS